MDLSKLDKASILAMSKWKQRSEDTHKETHVPELSALVKPINILLVGDSFMERFKQHHQCTMMHSSEHHTVFNAGVGGDRIQNVVYRLFELDLLALLKEKQVVDYIVLRMGTNNLKSKKAIPQEDFDAYRAVLVTLVATFPDAKTVVTGLTYRTDIPNRFVDDFNQELKAMVRELDDEKVTFLPAPTEIDIAWHLEDHVHLNAEGYTIWYEQLEKELTSAS